MISIWMFMTRGCDGLPVLLQLFWMAGCGAFSVGLLAACIMDLREQMVYRYWWLVAGSGAGILLLVSVQWEGTVLGMFAELGIYAVLQQTWFARFYGRADCHAYCVCAMALAALGMELIDYVIHMLITFCGLALVQLFRRNVDKNGRLKTPVALIPYITAAFWLWVDFKCGKWYI